MSTSRIPAVCAALVSTFAAALPNVDVIDGQWTTVPDGDYLTVGWTPDGEGSSGQQAPAGLGNQSRDEQIDIACYIDSYSGDIDTATRRNAAFTILAACENALRADDTLGGVVNVYAQIGAYTERLEQTETGLAVGVTFHVLAHTRI